MLGEYSCNTFECMPCLYSVRVYSVCVYILCVCVCVCIFCMCVCAKSVYHRKYAHDRCIQKVIHLRASKKQSHHHHHHQHQHEHQLYCWGPHPLRSLYARLYTRTSSQSPKSHWKIAIHKRCGCRDLFLSKDLRGFKSCCSTILISDFLMLSKTRPHQKR